MTELNLYTKNRSVNRPLLNSNLINKNCYLLIAILLVSFSFCKSHSLKIDAIYVFNYEKFKNQENLHIRNFDDNVWIVNKFWVNDDSFRGYFFYNLDEDVFYKIIGESQPPYIINDFFIKEDKLYISTYMSFLIYNIDNKNKTFILEKVIQTSNVYRNISLKNNLIVLHGCEQHSINIHIEDHLFCQTLIYDIDLDTTVTIKNDLYQPEGSEFLLFQPKNNISLDNKSNFLITDIINPNVNYFDIKGSLLKKETIQLDFWKDNKAENLNKKFIKTKDVKSVIENMRPMTDSLSFIHFSQFLNDTTFVVLYSSPDSANCGSKYYYYFAFFDYNDNNLSKIEEIKLKTCNDKVLSESDFIFSELSVSNNKIYITNYNPFTFDNIKNQFLGKEYKLYSDERNEYYKENELKISIFEYSIRE